MSRRPDPARAAQNQQTIKNLLKLEHNKTCADCKRNKHPRWASWNLGIFICIRCSGIHRGMGTHISRVKSVDLDAWTDEQLQSVLKWGNSRANKYWEAKLAPNHVPSESKIENFIRTKYESKRWVMDGPMPDPSTLGNDDDVPLAVVQERAKLERSTSQRTSVSSQPPARRQPHPSIDLIGDDDPPINPPARPSTTGPTAVARPPPPPSSAQPAAAKQTKPADSLLGLDFFGNSQSTPASRPGSTAPTSTSQAGLSRPDLKQSILSLYATAPKPQPAPAQHERTSSIGSTAGQSNVNSLTDAFSGLTFPSNPTSPPLQKPQTPLSNDVFAGLTGLSGSKPPPVAPKSTSSGSIGGGDLFSSIASSKQPAKPVTTSSHGLDFGFTQNFTSPVSQPPKPAPAPAPSASHDLFDLAAPAPASTLAPSQPISPPTYQPTMTSSVFNLSSNTAQHQPTQKAAPTTSTSNVTSMLSSASIDPWGGNAWSTPDPAPPTPSAAATVSSTTQSSSANPLADAMRMPDTLTSKDIGAGWGAPTASSTSAAPATAPAVAPEDDFGGWTSAAPVSAATTTSTTTTNNNKSTTSGFGASDDLFSNVWE